jgi:hypothetical protein
MSVFGTTCFLVAAMLAVSLGLGTGITLQAEGTQTEPAADTEIGSSPPTQVTGDAAVQLDKPFALAVDETAVLEGGLSVRFESVIEDSRCPSDVLCVWEGNAEIAIEVATGGEDPASVRLSTNPSFATEATYRSYTIELIGLEPYPRTDPWIDEPYRATMAVRLTGIHPTPTPNPSPSAVVLVDA